MASRWRPLAHLLIVGVGLVTLGWAVFVAPGPITCRNVVMEPGDVCHHQDFAGGQDKTQTYEQRLAAAQSSRPVIGVVGAAVAGFGIALWVDDRRKRRGLVTGPHDHATADPN